MLAGRSQKIGCFLDEEGRFTGNRSRSLEHMKSYFVAALSFVGVLGSAAGAMAINNDTLTHGGADLTDSASSSLIHTAMVNADGSITPVGVTPGAPGLTPTPDPQASGAPATPPALTNLPGITWNATTGGSSAGTSNAGPSNSAARPVTTPAAGTKTPVSAVTGGSSAAAPAPAPGTQAGNGNGTGSTPPAGGKQRGKEEDHSKDHNNKERDSNESGDD